MIQISGLLWLIPKLPHVRGGGVAAAPVSGGIALTPSLPQYLPLSLPWSFTSSIFMSLFTFHIPYRYPIYES